MGSRGPRKGISDVLATKGSSSGTERIKHNSHFFGSRDGTSDTEVYVMPSPTKVSKGMNDK